MNPIHVIGYVGQHSTLSPALSDAVARADLVVGGRRHLDSLDVPDERRVVLGPLDPAIEAMSHRGDRRVLVVASGDPGFFGIVRRLADEGLPLVVTPAPSSIALAFGRLGMAWEDAQIVSAHGRDLRPALNVVRAHPTVAVLTTVGAGVREIAAGLGAWPRTLFLLERLGEEGERVRRLTCQEALALDDVREPNVVIAVEDSVEAPRGQGRTLTWRLGDTGRTRPTVDPAGALVAGMLGLRPGELCALYGDGLAGVAAAVSDRGAALRRLPDAEPTTDLPALDEPDVLCLAATAADLPEVFVAVADLLRGARAVAVLTDEDGLEVSARALAGFGAVRLTVPRVQDHPGEDTAGERGAHLLLATRPGSP
ncbi:MAG: precorrin-6y C5,15-methyltransferase (decarboxylating) subunit CbiE [Mobilicoccus sp.]|nr:precorrin-6y C5,15-methyltransferase (decarboxylating) subunit CbiE [Mobilicoccus sp.]